jgi:hypothetical protein
MASADIGLASLHDVVAAIHAGNPHRPPPRSLDSLKNVRQRADERSGLALRSAIPDVRRPTKAAHQLGPQAPGAPQSTATSATTPSSAPHRTAWPYRVNGNAQAVSGG